MGIASLWLPILVSAILVFFASAAVWMVLPWHKTDYKPTPDEEAARGALKGATPGLYMIPHCLDQSEFKKPEVRQKYIDGPQAFITILPNGLPQMGPKLAMSFVYYLVVGGLCAYMVTRTGAADADYLGTFRIAGFVAFVAHGVASIPESIWFGQPWSRTAKNLFDALIYALLTGGAFGWLA